MKKLLSLIFLAGAMVFTISCGDEETPDAPTVTAPTAITDVEGAEDVEITFTIAAPGGFASASVAAVGGTAVVTTPPAAGATTGSILVTFSAGLEEGAGSVTLTITDDSDQTASATAVVNISSEITISGNITEDDTWESGKVYILAGRIAVVDGVTLTIEPGVVVKGEAGTGANASALLIARGAKLMAEGTANSPIIFTSIADELEPGDIASPNLAPDVSGLWGGLLIMGKAPISVSSNAAANQIEGIPASDTNGLYGGTDAADNSGVITYISIRHGGANIGEGNEINGLTLGGVGSGTVIENVEVIGNQDDGIEWFGGTVNVTNALVLNSGDDAIDTDQSWAGTLDNFVVICGAATDHALEIDGPEGTFLAGHTVTNGSVKGYIVTDAAGITIAGGAEHADFRSGARGTFSNIYFFGFPDPVLSGGRGDLSLSNTTGLTDVTGNFASGDLSFSGLETTLPTGIALATVFRSGVSAFGVAVAEGANTVGADKAAFASWTWAAEAGLLDEF